MDEAGDENAETSWVFVEEVDITEEALVLNADVNTNQESKEAYDFSPDRFETLSKSLTKSYSDSLLVTPNDKRLNTLNSDQGSESDGLSIISNWSYSPEASNEHLDDATDNNGKQNCDKNYQSSFMPKLQNNEDEEIQYIYAKEEKSYEADEACVGEELQNLIDDEDTKGQEDHDKVEEVDHTIIEDRIESDFEGVAKDGEEYFKGNEMDDNPDLPQISFPILSDEKILQCQPNLLDQLKWLDGQPDGIQETDNSIQKYILSRISENIKKKWSLSSFLIGTVLIAGSSIVLGKYFNTTETIQKDLPKYQEKVFLYDVPNGKNFDVQAALNFCKEQHKSNVTYIEINAHKYVTKNEKKIKCKKYKIKKDKIKTWEKHLELNENFLAKKKRKLRKHEAKVKSTDKNGALKINLENNKFKNYKKINPNWKIDKHEQLSGNKKYRGYSREENLKKNSKKRNKIVTVDVKKHGNEEKNSDYSKEKIHVEKFGEKHKNKHYKIKSNENDYVVQKTDDKGKVIIISLQNDLQRKTKKIFR